MKRIAGLVILLVCSQCLFAQPPGMGGQMPPAAGHIYGKLTGADGKPVADASVLLMQEKFDSVKNKSTEVLFKGIITKANGDFSFEELPIMLPLTLKVSRSGYKPYVQAVSFKPEPGKMPSMEKDLGNIKLEADTKELQGVVVTSVAPTVRLSGDKKIFNVEKNIMSAGGTGVDVMRNVPSVNVDIDGNITMRNSAPQLLVDGRPTTLTLDQIPADAIESVEVITAPSAKYDASGGGAGILNIVLKKNKKTGYNGNLRAGVDKRGALNGGADFNFRQNKFNFSAAINANQNKSRTNGYTDRYNLSDTQTHIYQDNFNKSPGGFLFAKVGVDYFATNRTTFSLTGIKVHGKFDGDETIGITTDSFYGGNKFTYLSDRITTAEREFNGQGLVFGFKQLFPKEGRELTVDANYFGGKFQSNSLYTTDYFAGNSNTIVDNSIETASGLGKDRNFVIQTDYTSPVGKKGKLEAGLRAAIRSRENINNNYIFDKSSNGYILVPSASTNYENTDNVYAAYATFSNAIKDFSYKVGLRAERSDYKGTLTDNNLTFKNNYPVSLFPSLFLSQKLSNKQELQLSITRRINRPNFFNLIPFTDYTDKLNITRGNPALKPEFTQAFELSHLKTFKPGNTLLTSVYYRYTTDLITRYLTQDVNSTTGATELINTFINANSSYSAGAEITLQNVLNKWWDISTNVNIYNSKVNTGIAGEDQDALWSWFAKFNSNFKLPANFAIQYTFTYQSKSNLPVNNNVNLGGPPMGQGQSSSQGYIDPSWGMDLAVKKSFLKNNAASVSLSINDIFRTRINSQYSSSAYFTQQFYRLRDPQMVRLNLSYRFGKIDASLFKRKTTKGEQNSAESMSN